MDDAVANGSDRRESVLFCEPVDQNVGGRPVIGGGDIKASLLLLIRPFERHVRSRQTDPVDLSGKRLLQRFASLVEGKLDARGAAIDGQDGLHSLNFQDGSFAEARGAAFRSIHEMQ